jgi:hypothetical protein
MTLDELDGEGRLSYTWGKKGRWLSSESVEHRIIGYPSQGKEKENDDVPPPPTTTSLYSLKN